MDLPSSMADYVKGIREVLPEGCVSADLDELEIFRFEKAYPDEGESLRSWIGSATRNSEGKLPLTMVVGESWSDYRQTRGGLLRRLSQTRALNMAFTSDGAAGAEAVVGLLRHSELSLQDVDFQAVIDEWCAKYPEVCQRVKNSHLVVVGTPEVNIFATFLHGMARDFHFGRRCMASGPILNGR